MWRIFVCAGVENAAWHCLPQNVTERESDMTVFRRCENASSTKVGSAICQQKHDEILGS